MTLRKILKEWEENPSKYRGLCLALQGVDVYGEIGIFEMLDLFQPDASDLFKYFHPSNYWGGTYDAPVYLNDFRRNVMCFLIAEFEPYQL